MGRHGVVDTARRRFGGRASWMGDILRKLHRARYGSLTLGIQVTEARLKP